MINLYKYSINSRIKKAVTMATDPTSIDRREMGFATLGRTLSPLEEYFDYLTVRNRIILTHLAFNSFRMTDATQIEAFAGLYRRDRTDRMFEVGSGEFLKSIINPRTTIDVASLGFWKGIVNWNRRKAGNPPITGIYSRKACPNSFPFFLFLGTDLRDISFLVEFEDIIFKNIMICSPSPHTRANFKESCFVGVDMHRTSIDHVDFSSSHLLRINYKEKERTDYKISCVGTIFDEANVLFCNFGEADFKDASFVETNITGSNFRRTKNLTTGQFKQRAYWIRPDDPQLLKEAKPLFPGNFPSSFADTLPDRAPE